MEEHQIPVNQETGNGGVGGRAMSGAPGRGTRRSVERPLVTTREGASSLSRTGPDMWTVTEKIGFHTGTVGQTWDIAVALGV